MPICLCFKTLRTAVCLWRPISTHIKTTQVEFLTQFYVVHSETAGGPRDSLPYSQCPFPVRLPGTELETHMKKLLVWCLEQRT